MLDYKISIVIPVYNAEKYIDATISSIVRNGLDGVEIICVDDGSTDQSLLKLKKYEVYKNISVIHKENEGAPSARNEGIRNARGEYILFFDSDDLMNEGALDKLLQTIMDNKADIIICNYQTISEDGKIMRKDDYKNIRMAISQNNKLLYLYLITPFPGAKLYRKKLLDENNIIFDNVKIGQDLNFYIKFLSHISSFKILDYSVASYRIVNGSISRSFDYRILDIIKSINMVREYYATVSDNDRKRFLNFASYSHLVFQYSKLARIENPEIRKEIQVKLETGINSIRKEIHVKNIYELLKLKKIDNAWSKNQAIIKKYNEG